MKSLTYPHFCDLDIEYLGPSLDAGEAPTVIYFSLCAQESLSLDPFNQPAVFLKKKGFRVYSITLPGHGQGFDKYKAMQYWADHLDKLYVFIQNVNKFIDHIVDTSLAKANQIGVMGLSRGGFIATHLAAHPHVKAALGFAPVTNLVALNEFQELNSNPLLEELSLEAILNSLIKKKIRLYIGNRDVRVSTASAFNFISKLAEAAFQKRIRSSNAELIVGPSIGQHGHGTSPQTFDEGASWLEKQIVK
ncbi:MAG: hypothetical protein S4CHLAM6_11750 [Chlamydiae bacterium]|nr:hypothetical protein [Chlamydiota bacterium]